MRSLLRRLLPRSVRSTAAAAAALAGAVLFLSGALWIRYIVHTERMEVARLDAALTAERITTVIDLGDRALMRESVDGQCLFSDRTYVISDSVAGSGTEQTALQLVGPDHSVLFSSDTLKPLERHGPVLPGPTSSGPALGPARRPAPHVPVRPGTGQTQTHTVPMVIDWPQAPPPKTGEATFAGRTYQVLSRDITLVDLSQPGAPCDQVTDTPTTVARMHILVLPFDADHAVANVDRILLPGVPAAVLLVALVAWLATDRALRPVERMRAEAARITSASLDQRLPVPPSHDHLSRLAETFNNTLDRLAAAADRQRRFVADAAHELRSPVGSLRVILDTAPQGPAHRHLQALLDASAEARRLHRLIDDLLLLSKLDINQPIDHQEVNVAHLATAQLADRGRAGPIIVVLNASRPATVLGNAFQLNRLLTNLLDNAERYARAQVTVDVTRNADHVLLAVSDDGPGVPAKHREHIFDRFTRLDEARDRDHGGTGLGLAIARDICVHHGGTLTVTDAVGGGAQFVALLPSHGS